MDGDVEYYTYLNWKYQHMIIAGVLRYPQKLIEVNAYSP